MGGDRDEAAALFAEHYPHSVHADVVARFPERQRALEHKAAIAVGTTTDAAWAGPLAALQPLATGFTTLVRTQSVLGTIPFRRVPLNSGAALVTAGAGVNWVGQGEPAPLRRRRSRVSRCRRAKLAG